MRKKKLRAATLAVLAGLCWQAEKLPAAETGMLDEVVVTANRIRETRKAMTANVTVIGREELERTAAATIGDLFTQLGISHIQKYPGALTSIAIRGFRTETHGNDLQGHVLVLLDGRRAGTGNMAKILTGNVERIEIIRGPGAVQYGSGGVGGVVNIITRRGNENRVAVEGGAGSFDEYRASIGAEMVQGGADFAGAVIGRSMGDYETGSGRTYPNTGYDAEMGVSANGGYTFSPGNRLGVIYTGYKGDEAGNPGYIDLPDRDDYTDKDYYSLDLHYEGAAVGGGYQWLARYFIGHDENSWSYPVGSNPDGWDLGTTDTNATDQQGAQIQISTSRQWLTLTGGADWVRYEVENTWSPEKTDYANPALFLLGKSMLFDERLVLTGGLRYDWYSVEVEQPAGNEESDSNLTPSIGAAFMITDSLKVRGRFAEGFVMPSADQLAADYMNWGIRTVGNPNLKPEKSSTWDGGFDYARDGFRGSFTYFTTDFEDKITNFILADGASSWINQGSAAINGLEAEMSYDLGVPLDLPWELRPYFNLTLLTEFEDEATGEDLLYLSETNYSAGLVVSDGLDWFCRFNVAYSGSQLVQDWQAGIYPVPIVELDSFVVADLTASYRFLESKQYGSWSVKGEIRNLFDDEYGFVLANPMPGRSFFAGLRVEY